MREKRKRTTKKGTMTTVGYSIPLDLMIEILARLPTESVKRFTCVSKSWCSIIRSKQFRKAFMTHSLSRPPRLVLSLIDLNDDRLLFFSSSHHQSCSSFSSKSSLLFAETTTLTIPEVERQHLGYIKFTTSVHGFVCCKFRKGFVVYNPTTGQAIHLPQEQQNFNRVMYLGYDPKSDQFKVLLIEFSKSLPIEHSVCTLEGQRSTYSWRPIKTCIRNSNSFCHEKGVCIDGVVYYLYQYREGGITKIALGSFDVGSEQLRLIETPEGMLLNNVVPNFFGMFNIVSNYLGMSLSILANYLGKLAVHQTIGNSVVLWVLDDVKNQVWSRKTFNFSSFTTSIPSSSMRPFVFAGITAYGEFVYFPEEKYGYSSELLVYDAEKKMERRVKVKGLPRVRKLSKDNRAMYFYSSPILCSFDDNIMVL